jgi:hypothetical protein
MREIVRFSRSVFSAQFCLSDLDQSTIAQQQSGRSIYAKAPALNPGAELAMLAK